VGLALVLTAITLWRTGAWQQRHGQPTSRRRWRALYLASLAYASGIVALLLL
jgi:hypothetical protein